METLESPRFARVLYSKCFQAVLQAVYIDEAHLVKESLNWRPGYARLYKLRAIIGEGTPLVAISATLPSSYRDALHTYAGLKPRHSLINLGNFRAELSIVVKELQYDAGSFQDLGFTVPLGTQQLMRTVAYCDNVDMLTSMLTWYRTRLRSMGLSESYADIMHAGLSDEHQRIALQDFREGRVYILCATEKIGAGINLPRVERVVQYLTRNNITLAKLDQRRGRGARSAGMTAVGYLLVEPELMHGDLEELEGSVDPGILALVRATGCYQAVIDKWLENPIRLRPFTYTDSTRLCCSHCHPHLAAIQDFPWIMVDFGGEESKATPLSSRERDLVFEELCILRATEWKDNWCRLWPGFGPRALVADADLEAVARIAPCIKSVEDLRPLVRVAYWRELTPWLLRAIQDTVNKLNIRDPATEDRHPDQPLDTTPVSSSVTSQPTPPDSEGTLVARSSRGSTRRARTPAEPGLKSMHPEEMLIKF